MTNEMPNDMSTTPPAPGQPDTRQRNIIIAVVVGVVLLCCCCLALAAGIWLWTNGDQLLEGLGDFSRLLPALAALA